MNDKEESKRLKEDGFKKFRKPHDVFCFECGRMITRYTNIPTKRCHCGARIVFSQPTAPTEKGA